MKDCRGPLATGLKKFVRAKRRILSLLQRRRSTLWCFGFWPGYDVRRAALVKGVDGLAWYVTFHARGPQWGIYLPVSSIVGVAETVFGTTTLDLPARMRLAAHVMHQHELFHFAVDYMTGLWELLYQRPCWKPGLNLRNTSGYYELEEQLANAHMLRRINAVTKGLKVSGRAAVLRRFVCRCNRPVIGTLT